LLTSLLPAGFGVLKPKLGHDLAGGIEGDDVVILLRPIESGEVSDRTEGEAKLPVLPCHGPELFTTPIGLAAKLCTIAAAEDGFSDAFFRQRCITVETVSGPPR
jgi:hypothetical protein